ncbi:MAG: glycosyltransferase [candidate division Zixibacteria bacterium]|nr:glycosyltransferase [candidate division Zixibacteria bacterium]
MQLLSSIAVLLAIIYSISLIYLLFGLLRSSKGMNTHKHFLSVVVPVHNEAGKIQDCMKSLAVQDYPGIKYEVIIVDDCSADNTSEIVQRFCEKNPNFRYLRLDNDERFVPKKSALLKALDNARGEIIVSTEADCLHSAGWLSSLNSYFDLNTGLVAGHVEYRNVKSWSQGIDALDYFSQRVLGASFIQSGTVYTCSAANMAYRKDIYEKSREVFKNLKVRPADDNFLLNFTYRKTDYDIASADSKDSVVKTDGASNLIHFLNQRFRWSAYGDKPGLAMQLFFIPAMLLYIFLWILSLASILNPSNLVLLILPISIKLIADFLFLFRASGYYRSRHLMKYFLPSWIVNLILVPLIVIKGNLSTFEWKGKKYTKTAEVKA